MTIRKTTLTGLAVVVTLLLLLSGCNITFYGMPWDLEPETAPLFTFSLEWTDNGTDDPHLYMTYPAPVSDDTTASGTPVFTEPYLLPNPLVGDLGFYPIDIDEGVPNEATHLRGAVYYGNLDSSHMVSSVPAVEMTDVNNASEIILVRGFPFTSSSVLESTPGGGITGLDPGSYTWVGIMEVYGYAMSGQLEYASGSGVNAVLNVFHYDDLFAVYELPANTDLKGSSIVRINCFYEGNTEVYQLVPDIRVIQSTTQIRSVAPGAVVDDSGIITVRRPIAE